MRIGIDFDNTIACYEGVFYKAALERELIPADLATSKNAVRDHLNNSGRNNEFTELQGYIYGARMDLVAPYPGVADFVRTARASGHTLFVVSHKTRHPMMGPKYEMHDAARGFLKAQKLVGDDMIDEDNVYFELTKEEKVARAASLGVEAFIDDLPEILAMPGFPKPMRAILFDPNEHHTALPATTFDRCSDWAAIKDLLIKANA